MGLIHFHGQSTKKADRPGPRPSDANDQVRILEVDIAMEIPSQHGGRGPGIHGWTSVGDGHLAWISGHSFFTVANVSPDQLEHRLGQLLRAALTASTAT